MINLLVRGKGLMQDVADFAVACYARQRHPSRSSHYDARAFHSSARSNREHGYRRPRTSGSDFLVLLGDVADMPKKRVTADEHEPGGRKSGWRGYAGACVAWLYGNAR